MLVGLSLLDCIIWVAFGSTGDTRVTRAQEPYCSSMGAFEVRGCPRLLAIGGKSENPLPLN